MIAAAAIAAALASGPEASLPPPEPAALQAAVAAPATVTAEEAERLARAGRTHEALAAFQALVAKHPDDFDSLVWIGRMLVRLGRRPEAVDVFRDVIARSPRHVDARVGLGGALLGLGRLDEAAQVVAEAEALAPASSDVLGLKGRTLRMLGRPSEALGAYDAAFAIAPQDGDVAAGREQTSRQVAHRAHASFAFEHSPDGIPTATIVDTDVDFHLDDRHRLFGRVQWQERGGVDDTRAGGGVEFRLARQVVARATFMAAPGSLQVAQADAHGEIEVSAGRWTPGMAVRYLDFATARVWIFAPSVTFDVTDTFALVGRYYRSESEFFVTRQAAGNNSGALMFRWRSQPRLTISGGYAKGNESFDILSVDRLGRFEADTAAGGVRYDFPSLTSIGVGVEQQWRTGGQRLLRVALDVVQHF